MKRESGSFPRRCFLKGIRSEETEKCNFLLPSVVTDSLGLNPALSLVSQMGLESYLSSFGGQIQ